LIRDKSNQSINLQFLPVQLDLAQGSGRCVAASAANIDVIDMFITDSC